MEQCNTAITGHRDIQQQDSDRILGELELKLKELKVKSILVGSADGVDQLARQVANKLGITVLDLPEEAAQRNSCEQNVYVEQAEYIIGNSSQIIAVWDGIFTQKPGGTSDIVQRALRSNKDITIHHLVCARVSNPHPVASLLDEVIDFEKGKFTRIPFALPFSWVKHKVTPIKKVTKKAIFWEGDFQQSYLVPGFFALLTIVFGMWGFSDIHSDDSVNNFFRSLNLITLGNSVIEGKDSVKLILNLARLTGFLTATTAIGFAIYAATKKYRRHRKLKRWAKKGDFHLIVGLNEQSFDLIVDLSRHHQKNVVVLHSTEQSDYLNTIQNLKNVITVKGRPYSGTSLQLVHAAQAHKVFIMGDSDTNNIRATQELDLLSSSNSDVSVVDRYVHLAEEDKRQFLSNSLSDSGRNRNMIINFYENTIRRLMLYYPIDRFYQVRDSNEAHAIVIGFESLGRLLTLTLLKQGHYPRDKKLFITVYTESAQDCESVFLRTYPQFDMSAFGNDVNSNIVNYTWANISLQFLELPVSDSEWLTDENNIFSSFKSKAITNIYACLPNGIKSAAFLNILLPKIEIIKQETNANVQVFCYYNFPDKKEESIIEDYFNRLAPSTFVKCFGNFLDECSVQAIQDISLDALPKLINASYDNSNRNPELLWLGLSEKDKISNRQTADHLWCKIRSIWPKIDWKFDRETFEPYPEVAKVVYSEKSLQEYGEIEHRRWCADLLLQGFVPFNLEYNSEEYREVSEKWKDKKYKNRQQIQKRHISLVPYKFLTTIDKNKDIDQIKAISYLLRGVVEAN